MKKCDFPAEFRNQKGIGLIEIIIVLLVLAIIVVLALPQLNASRRLFKYAGMQKELITLLREARQEAMTQRRAVTFTYDDSSKNVIFSGGSYNAYGDLANRKISLAGGSESGDLVYGRPSGATAAALGDKTNLTSLDGGKINVTFQSDGSVLDASGNPSNKAMFFYSQSNPASSAFAVSVLGAGGRIKLWRYVTENDAYVE